jgi:glutathione S-transferase
MEITLYHAPMSSAVPAVHALAELDVPHRLVGVDLSAGEQRRPEFLALNPNGKVPTLVVDGTVMFETLAIMQWLGDKFGVSRGLWPAADDPARLVALSWSAWAYATFGAALQRLNFAGSERVPAELHHAGQVKHVQSEMQELLAVLNGRLVGRPWLLGEAFSLADLIVASVITYSTYCGVSVDDHHEVRDWLARFQARPAFQAAWAGH